MQRDHSGIRSSALSIAGTYYQQPVLQRILLLHVYKLFLLYVLLADVCDLPKRTGHCRAYMPRWFYNKNTGQCEKFVYRGCGGNMNNFETAAECRGMCPCPRLVCKKKCEFCHQLDKDGCPTCDCRINPCFVSIVNVRFYLCFK